jgi:uncharacterized protein YegL
MSQGGKIQALNNAIREVIPHMRATAEQHPEADVLVRAVTFADGARWHIGEPASVQTFHWPEVSASGLTDLGAALSLVAEGLSFPSGYRGWRPVLVLAADGEPTDDFEAGLRKLESTPWGAKSLRVAIAIGRDANQEKLRRFVGNDEYPILQANNADELVHWLRWASTAVVGVASSPVPGPGGRRSTFDAPPPPPPPGDVSIEVSTW